jgi:glycosyltransferase involved in cell wall biosynthesis
LQTLGYDLPVRAAERVVVHTQAAYAKLIARGVSPAKVRVIPHGPLPLPCPPSGKSCRGGDPRYVILLFGEIKPYKGPDIFVEAIAGLPEDMRRQARFIIAGRPRMDLVPLRNSIREHHLEGVVEVHARRFSDQEMTDLLIGTDCFVFPYRQIDASGVYFLVNTLGKWIIATRVGIFAEDMVDSRQGTLIPPDDPAALAEALQRAIVERPVPATSPLASDWGAIGQATLALYQEVVGTVIRPPAHPGATVATSH